jgi:hypothetical protein
MTNQKSLDYKNTAVEYYLVEKILHRKKFVGFSNVLVGV